MNGNNPTSSVDYRIDREQLIALRTATRNSKTAFDSDMGTLSNAVSQLDTEGPIVETMVGYLNTLLSDSTYDDNYTAAITRISNILG